MTQICQRFSQIIFIELTFNFYFHPFIAIFDSSLLKDMLKSTLLTCQKAPQACSLWPADFLAVRFRAKRETEYYQKKKFNHFTSFFSLLVIECQLVGFIVMLCFGISVGLLRSQRVQLISPSIYMHERKEIMNFVHEQSPTFSDSVQSPHHLHTCMHVRLHQVEINRTPHRKLTAVSSLWQIKLQS